VTQTLQIVKALDSAAPDLPGRGNALVLLPGEHCNEHIFTMQCSTIVCFAGRRAACMRLAGSRMQACSPALATSDGVAVLPRALRPNRPGDGWWPRCHAG
jgi:hypothetical protein